MTSAYCSLVSLSLPTLPAEAAACSVVGCTDHTAVLDTYVDSLYHCLHDCALRTLPKVRASSSCVPGWNRTARLLKDKANFWFSVWKSAGSPSNGVLHQIKKSSKSRYKYEVRRLRRQELHIRRERLASVIAASRSRDFWLEVKRTTKPQRSCIPAKSVDGVHGLQDIANLFASRVTGYLNTHDACLRDDLLSSMSSSISSADIASFSISVECIRSAFSKLKLCKSDGSILISDHLIMCLPVIAESLSALFTSMVHHSFMPKLLRDCTLVPIPKSGKDPRDISSYRAIALAPTLSKALELCLLLQFPDQFSTSDFQFGYKRFMSTPLCTGTAKNVAHHYIHNGSHVYGCLLYASKAFDLVRHDILFDRLSHRGLPQFISSFLLNWYKSQELCVRWGKVFSSSFTVSNGVRQGGVLSPVLFTIYMDELLLQLKHNAVGCHWDHHFAGAFCYADDLILLASSLSHFSSFLFYTYVTTPLLV